MTAIIGYRNVLDSSTVTVTTEATGFDVENAFDYNTFDYWKPTAVPAYFTADAGSSVPVDYFALNSHDLSDNGASIKLQYSSDNFASNTNDAFAAVTPSTNNTILKLFTSVSARYWRVLLTGGVSSLGFVIFGARLSLPYAMRVGYQPIHRNKALTAVNQTSENGNFLSRSLVRSGLTGDIVEAIVPDAWIESYWDDMVSVIELRPFIFCANEARPQDAVLCMTKKIKYPQYSHNTFQDFSFEVFAAR